MASLSGLVGKVCGEPAVRTDGEQHELARGSSELRLDESACRFLRQISAGDGEHLPGGRSIPTTVPSTVTYLYGNSSRWTDRLSTSALRIGSVFCALRPCEEREVAARLVAVPDRYGQRRPVVVAGDAEYAYARLREELLSLFLGP